MASKETEVQKLTLDNIEQAFENDTKFKLAGVDIDGTNSLAACKLTSLQDQVSCVERSSQGRSSSPWSKMASAFAA